MTNKTLFLVVVAILVIGAAAAGYFYWQQTKPLVIPPPVAQNNTQVQDSQQATPVGSSQLSANNATTTPPSANPAACVREFSQSKLTADANMNIANRQVQINVKDFGSITVEFYNQDAPLAVQNFLRLTDSGYYDCLTFHRVAAGFVIQGGDPSGNGTGGQSAFGKPFADELNPNTPSYKAGYLKGVLAMANSGPNTNGSQFFIMLADNNLPHNYTIFGRVLSGQDVVDKIGDVPITPVMSQTDGSPKTPVVMESVKIIK
jgi:cyclophilin family peptidyl-prolyl cis-trans isomerase